MSLTIAALKAGFHEIEERGWTESGSGPWVDAMDLALRRFEIRHQFAIAGYAIGVCTTPVTEERRLAAWLELLAKVNFRAAPLIDVDPGYGRQIRPASVLPDPPPSGPRRRTR